MVSSFAALCVLAAAARAVAGDAAIDRPSEAPAAADLAGRWEGRTFELARAASDCGDTPCTLTLDLARCASGWCGVEVIGAEHRCGATALRLDDGTEAGGSARQFKGRLELAKGTEPYVVEAYLVTLSGEGAETQLQIVGDTGGEFRMFRRSFPFNATLVRVSDAKCRPESTVSLLE